MKYIDLVPGDLLFWPIMGEYDLLISKKHEEPLTIFTWLIVKNQVVRYTVHDGTSRLDSGVKVLHKGLCLET